MSVADVTLPAVDPDEEPGTLRSFPGLIRAAIALGADEISSVSDAEIEIARGVEGAYPPRHAEIRRLREAILNDEDPLGDAFCALRSAPERRQNGATYTPRPIVRAMVDWAAAQSPPARIIDPGSGSARFAVAAGLRFPDAQVVAVELDPIAALISRANLAVRGMTGRATVVVRDYRAFTPAPIEGATLYIGNPPYVRHHKITKQWKEWLAFTAKARGLAASQLAGLHVHFFLATVAGAQAGDGGVFITSSEWLDVNYGSLVRELVLDGLGGQAIHVLTPEVRPFEDAQTTGAITCFAIGSTPSSLRLRRVDSVKDLKKLEGGRAVRRERLVEAQRWSPFLRAAAKVPEGHVELGEICRVHRGAVTGANRVWVVDPATVELPHSVLFPSVTRARELFAAGPELGTKDRLRVVIDLPSDLDELDVSDRPAVERFIRAAQKLGAHEGYVARHRRAWWSVGLRRAAPILATYMARRAPAVVRNVAGARHINVAHGIYPREPLSSEMMDGIAKALRGSIHVRHGRTYAGGLTKFEPKEMERLLIPNVLAQ
jgi:adenine-specific DNA-methyltransferase